MPTPSDPQAHVDAEVRWRRTDLPDTLLAASTYVTRTWPGRGASAQQLAAYHRRAARVYDHVAAVDTGHANEARFLASDERAQAEALEAS